MTATATDPDGDMVHYSTTGAAGRHNDGWLVDEAVGKYLRVLSAQTNTLTVTNVPRVRDFAVSGRMGVTDGKGGADVKRAEFFTLRDATKLRELNPVLQIGYAPDGRIKLNCSVTGTSSAEAFWTFTLSARSQSYGQAGIFPVNTDSPFYGTLGTGPTVFRAQVMDTNGNFSNSQQLRVDVGSYDQFVPDIRIRINTLIGPTPLRVVADMGDTDPGEAHALRYWALIIWLTRPELLRLFRENSEDAERRWERAA